MVSTSVCPWQMSLPARKKNGSFYFSNFGCVSKMYNVKTKKRFVLTLFRCVSFLIVFASRMDASGEGIVYVNLDKEQIMKVYISHTYKDAALAKKVATILRTDGLNVWNEEDEIMPGDNWAEKISQALKESEAMVVLLTPAALESKNVRREIEYALGEESYSHRLIPVAVGDPQNLPDEKIPWILKRLNMITLPEQGGSEEDLKQVAEALKTKA